MAVRQLPIDENQVASPEAEPSMWSKLGGMFSGNQAGSFLADNADIIGSLGMNYARYAGDRAKQKQQDMINQAAAKWSGFNPNLMNLIKTVDTPNPAGLVMEAIAEAPKFWYDIDKLYQARAAAKNGNDEQMEKIKNREALEKAMVAEASSKWGQ